MSKSTYNSWQEELIDRYYHQNPKWVGGTDEFWSFFPKYAPTEVEKVLEVGCGPDNQTSIHLKKTYGVLDGLDVDPEAGDNPNLDSFFLYDGGTWPLPSNSYDVIVADYVLEHIEKPMLTMSEVFRVLKPGGSFFFRTPNLWHYVSLVSAMSPHWFHTLVANRLRNKSSEAHDPYPTYYHFNTKGSVMKVMNAVGFHKQELRLVEKEPSYGMSSKFLFYPMMAYERVVNSTSLFSSFRSNLFGAFQKPFSS